MTGARPYLLRLRRRRRSSSRRGFFRRGTTPEAATAAAAAAAQLTRDAGRDYDDGPGGPARSGPVGPIEPACPRNYLRLVLSRRRCTVAMLICLIA